jgi:hypothetical protein
MHFHSPANEVLMTQRNERIVSCCEINVKVAAIALILCNKNVYVNRISLFTTVTRLWAGRPEERG